MKNIYLLEQALLEQLGYEQLCEAIIRQMSYAEKLSAFEYIARMYDIEIEEEE